MAGVGVDGSRLTLLLNHEISNVVSSMRMSAKHWHMVAKYHEEDRNEPSKFDDTFRNLRSEIFKYSDWKEVDPMVYLGPFLQLLKTPDVSGPITGVAALALQRIITSDLILPSTRGAGPAINQIVVDATLSKFESTNSGQDEVVLLNVVKVIGMAVDCPAGLLLTDDTILKAFQATYMLGDPTTTAKDYGAMMVFYSQKMCGSIIKTLFTRLRHMARGELTSVQCKHGIQAAVQILNFLVELVEKDDKDPAINREQVEETLVFAFEMVYTALLALGPEVVVYDVLVELIQIDMMFTICQAVVNFPSVHVINGFCQLLLCFYTFIGPISIGQIELMLKRVLLKLAEGKGVLSLEQQEAAMEGVLDLCRQQGFVHDIFVNCDCRLERANLFEAVCTLINKTAFPVAKGTLGPLHFISLEALLAILNAIGADKKPANMFTPPPPDLELPCFVDIWTPMVDGSLLDLGPLVEAGDRAAAAAAASSSGHDHHHSHHHHSHHHHHQAAPAAAAAASGLSSAGSGIAVIESAAEHAAAAAGGPNSSRTGREGGSSGPSDFMRLRSAVYERHMKLKVNLAVDHFNKDHKKGFLFLQASKLMPKLHKGDGPAGPGEVDANQLAMLLGRFLHVCPGLNKVSIGELLGEPDPFYLKVLDAYSRSFTFKMLSFDQAIRLFLESFRLPGEAQKIDRIINSFGLQYYEQNKELGIFKSADAAYVLAYSVIMLNTDQHNSQVKNKMSLESFRRNLRGVNENSDFPEEFLNEIYYSIVKTALRMNEASGLDVSKQRFTELAQGSRKQRGRMIHADPGRHLFDNTMFRLMWGPAVHAMTSIIDNVSNEALVESALQGLQMAAQIAASHQLEDVADHVVVNLSKIPQQIVHVTNARPEVSFGRDAKMRAVTRTIATVANRHGDQLQTGWTNILDLILCFYRQQMLPEPFAKALDGDGEGGLQPIFVSSEGASTSTSSPVRPADAPGAQDGATSSGRGPQPSPGKSAANGGIHAPSGAAAGEGLGGVQLQQRMTLKQRRALAKQQASGGTGFFNRITSLTSILPSLSGEPEFPERQTSDADRAAATLADEVVTRCCFEDMFTDSKFLKQESLDHLVRAIIWAAGPIPRPAGPAVGTGGPAGGGGAGALGQWDVSELCLELLFTVLIRNRDRIGLLWPRVYEFFKAIFSNSREVDPALVQKAIIAMMRLCQRLLPYKADISEPLLKGMQLVSLVNEQMASDMAGTIAVEIRALLKGTAPFIQQPPVWLSICGLIKIIQYDPPSFAVCVETLEWVVKEALTPYNFMVVLQTVVDLLEHAVPVMRIGNVGHPEAIPGLLALLLSAEEWLELWWISMQRVPAVAPNWGVFKDDAWFQLVSSLCRAIKNPNDKVRSTSVSYLQRSVVAAEKLQIKTEVVQKALQMLLLPMATDLSKEVLKQNKDYPQADDTVKELVRAVVKVVLLYAEQLQKSSTFGSAWQAILDCLTAAMTAAPRSELLADAIPEALKNMLLVLHTRGNLREGWVDASDGTDLWETTWRVAGRISPNLTPALLKG